MNPTVRGGTSSANVLVANAPCSYGAFEITVGIEPNVPGPVALLDHMVEAGYIGTDLGPIGYLGQQQLLYDRLSERSLGLAGGFIAMPFSEGEALNESLVGLEKLLNLFDALPCTDRRPRPTLADAGSELRRRFPGGAVHDRMLGLDSAGWRRFARGLSKAVDYCRGRGYEPTLHHHGGTYVEAPWEIDRALEMTDVGLCLDTGHLLLGGGDPLDALSDWGMRINHVHLKDVRLSELSQAVSDAASMESIWRRPVFCALGRGDIDLVDVIEGLRKMEYQGWVVVEQDRVLESRDDFSMAARDQVENREYLRKAGM